jgi:hypothetical protein
MSKTVQIMGGPEDGKFIAVRDDVWELKMAVARFPEAPWFPQEPSSAVGYVQVCLPIERHGGRWYAMWKEPKC